eukprot:UN05401
MKYRNDVEKTLVPTVRLDPWDSFDDFNGETLKKELLKVGGAHQPNYFDILSKEYSVAKSQ